MRLDHVGCRGKISLVHTLPLAVCPSIMLVTTVIPFASLAAQDSCGDGTKLINQRDLADPWARHQDVCVVSI